MQTDWGAAGANVVSRDWRTTCTLLVLIPTTCPRTYAPLLVLSTYAYFSGYSGLETGVSNRGVPPQLTL